MTSEHALETKLTERRRFFMTKEQRRFVKFGLVGGSGVFVNLAVALAFSRVVLVAWADRDLADQIATLAGILVSIFTNFLINDSWTWGDRDKRAGTRSWMKRCGFYYATNGVAGALQWAVSAFTITLIAVEGHIVGFEAASVRAGLAALVGIAVATPLNYVINNKVTFRETQR